MMGPTQEKTALSSCIRRGVGFVVSCELWGVGCGVWDVGFRVWGLGLGSRFWGLGCEEGAFIAMSDDSVRSAHLSSGEVDPLLDERALVEHLAVGRRRGAAEEGV